MTPIQNFFATITVLPTLFVATGIALASYRGEAYFPPRDWPWMLAVLIAAALLRLKMDGKRTL